MHRKSLSTSEKTDWLRLIRTERIGPVTFWQLMERYGSAGAALDAVPALASKGGRKKRLAMPTLAAVRAEMDEAQSVGAEIIGAREPEYPPLLSGIDDAPPLLFVRGNVHLLQKPMVAIVGARNASANGKRFAETMARQIGAAGPVVVSGLARGIDTAAHAGALDTGTVASMAGGVDTIYPVENEDLFAAILERGVVMSESPMGVQAQARHFPRRNRVIAGTSVGVVVVEAAIGSGSLITARMAGEQGREVLAVPGSPMDPRCRGTNALIRDGATLVESANDVLAALVTLINRPLSDVRWAGAASLSGQRMEHVDPSDSARHAVVEHLSPTPVSVDELIRQCHLSPPIVMTILLELELAGRVDRHPGNRVSLIGG